MMGFMKVMLMAAVSFVMVSFLSGVAAAGDCSGYFDTIRHWVSHKQDNDGKCEMENVPDSSEYPAHSIPYKLRNGKELCPKNRYEMDWEYLWKNGKRISGIRYAGSELKMTVKFRDSFVPLSPVLLWKNEKLFCEVPIDTDGKPDGVVKEYDAEGTLTFGQRMVKGKRKGGFVRFDKHGDITSFACEDKPLFDGDVKRCGFKGKPSVVELSDGTLVTHVNGKLTVKETVSANKSRTVNKYSYSDGGKETVQTLHYHKNGALFQSYSVSEKKREGKFLEYTDNGKLVIEKEYHGGNCLSEKAYYLNGNLKEESIYKTDGKSVSKKEFWDNGQLKIKGAYLIKRRHYGTDTVPFGKMYEYSETGTLLEEANYDNEGNLDGEHLRIDEKGKRIESVYRKGILSAKKVVSADGKLESSEEYYEDGSRKR